jgi:hypothetical protein
VVENLMKQQQAILVICTDEADIRRIAAGIRGIPGVKEVRTGAFRQEHYEQRRVAMFFPQIPKGTQPPGIVVEGEQL